MTTTSPPPSPDSALWIAGLSIRTTNAVAATSIPPLWARYMTDLACKTAQTQAGAVPGASVYAVYCDFDRADPAAGDIMSLGYRLVIGVPVPAQPNADSGLDAVLIPSLPRQCFEVPRGRPDQVGAAWFRIWGDTSLKRQFQCDYERYDADGSIGIYISVI